MKTEIPVAVQRVVEFTPKEKIRIGVLKQNIADSQHLIVGLKEEEARLIKRLSQIPEHITTVQDWLDTSTQELDSLQGSQSNNGYPIPSRPH